MPVDPVLDEVDKNIQNVEIYNIDEVDIIPRLEDAREEKTIRDQIMS